MHNGEPLCYFQPDDPVDPSHCNCRLIAKVRNDERERAYERVMVKTVPFGLEHMEMYRYGCAIAARGDE